eukprot:TRINITY_DN93916_c0_g1_i1.p1 TRINITY_DN93916_c0_g1~~TRINITY_DN93916_c0_g1_i1.p1  ORF type:complete len:371 (-),score=53.38 TRINITY_DN93916_c0_g1_i1:86-1060(-)
MVLTASSDGTAKLWNVQTGECVQTIQVAAEGNEVWTAVFSPDASTILTASDDQTASLWCAFTGNCLKQFEGHTGEVMSAVFSSDGRDILTASIDATARLWDLASGETLQIFKGHTSGVLTAVFIPPPPRNPAGERSRFILTASSDGGLFVWNAASGQILTRCRHHHSHLRSAFPSPDGDMIVLAYGLDNINLVGARQGQGPIPGYIQPIQKFLKRGDSDPDIWSAVFSPDGSKVLTAALNGNAKLWQIGEGVEMEMLQKFSAGETEQWSAAFSADGSMIITGAGDGSAKLWDAETGELKQTFAGHESRVLCASFFSVRNQADLL